MPDAEDYIIEFTSIGGSVKVTAVDPATMTEVSIIGGANYSQEFLIRQVVKKLEFVLAKSRKDAR